MQRLDAMLARLRESVDAEPQRATATANGLAASRALVGRFFPLVHRTGSERAGTILEGKILRADKPCTDRELSCGIPRASYFFLGCPAFPNGSVAFLAKSSSLTRLPASFTPFDTGSLDKYARLRARPDWEAHEKDAFLPEHLGQGREALDFASEYIAAHFESPTDYVRRPQQSEPDFPTYHGLESTSGDRRAWSIEIQLHEDLPLDPAHIAVIVIGQHDRGLDIPDELFGQVVSAESDDITLTIQNLIAAE